MEETPIRLFGLVLAPFQITLQKVLAGAVKRGLRVLVMSTRGHASQGQEKQNECYGFVWPLAATVVTDAVASPTQPIFILMPVSWK